MRDVLRGRGLFRAMFIYHAPGWVLFVRFHREKRERITMKLFLSFYRYVESS